MIFISCLDQTLASRPQNSTLPHLLDLAVVMVLFDVVLARCYLSATVYSRREKLARLEGHPVVAKHDKQLTISCVPKSARLILQDTMSATPLPGVRLTVLVAVHRIVFLSPCSRPALSRTLELNSNSDSCSRCKLLVIRRRRSVC